MKDTMKKRLGILLATVCVGTVFAGCSSSAYKGDTLDGVFDKTATVTSNGGFAVERGDYVYFINGKESPDKENKYGEVVKSALMCIKKTDLAQGNYDKVKTIVPSLFASQNYDAGIYIYGEYVYYATPTTAKTMEGTVANTHIDFKRAKLDGTEAPMKDYFFRLENTSESNYRFVQVPGKDTVYCLYEEGGVLKSFNTDTNTSTVLVSGAKSEFFYDEENATNPVVYYTMGVKASLDGQEAGYDQLYSVRADATVTGLDSGKASYTVSNGYTYDFDEVAMKEDNEEALAEGGTAKYKFDDYTTYPYVNLGKLVLDGVGMSTTKTQYTHSTATPIETAGYNYTINGYRDGGLYFSRSAVQKNDSDVGNKLYYVTDVTASTWDSISANDGANFELVATDDANTENALFYKDGNKHYYLYVSGEKIFRAGYDNEAQKAIDDLQITNDSVGSATLWTLDKQNGEVYYWVAKASGKGNGNALSKLRYNGEPDDYNTHYDKAEFKPVTLDYVDFNADTDWYMPEFIGDTLLYGNAQSFGSESYVYVYATKLGSVVSLAEKNEKYNDVQTFITDAKNPTAVQDVMQYYFRTGKTEYYDAVKEKYSASQKKAIAEFVEKFGTDKEFANAFESNFISFVGKMTDEDKEEIAQSFKDSLAKIEETDTTKKIEPWIIWTIVGGGVALILAGVATILIIVSKKKKAEKARQASIVNAGKRAKVDVQDDKSINVYDEESEE